MFVVASKFVCDGIEHPISILNDDYCDCVDQTDEPLTSACAATFECLNNGYKSKTIHSMLVNDGICDCCDGSDENNEYQKIKCPNTCKQLLTLHKSITKEKNNIIKQGVAKKQKILATAQAEKVKDLQILNLDKINLKSMQIKEQLFQKKQAAPEQQLVGTDGNIDKDGSEETPLSEETTPNAVVEQVAAKEILQATPDEQFEIFDWFQCFTSPHLYKSCFQYFKNLFLSPSLIPDRFQYLFSSISGAKLKTEFIPTQEIRDLESKIKNLEDKLSKIYGDDDIYYGINDCIKKDYFDYTYEYCFLNKVEQTVKNGHSRVGLG